MPFGVEAPLRPNPEVDLDDGLSNRLERILHLNFGNILAVFFELVEAEFVAFSFHQGHSICVVLAFQEIVCFDVSLCELFIYVV